MSAHGHNSISNCVRAARTGKEQVSLFTEPTAESAPLKAKERRWSEARRARGAATLQHVGARLGLLATGPPAWRLVLDVSGG